MHPFRRENTLFVVSLTKKDCSIYLGIEKLFADSYDFEFSLLVHHDMIHIEDSTLAVDKDWLAETCLLTNCNPSFVNQVNFLALGISGLDNLPMLVIVIL